jgi:hypothetical protein
LHPHPSAASALILLIVPLLAITVRYIAACAIWPFVACRKCGGAGRRRSPSGRAWRYCRRCGGTGARLRTGRRTWNYLRHLHKEGHR